MTQRTERIDELLRQEIGRALEREVTDPGIGFVTVTEVQTVPDLSRALVWVSVIGSEEQRKTTLAALRRAMPYIRHGLGSKIRLRRIPDEIDDASESLPTPVPRLRHEGDTEEEPPVGNGVSAGAAAPSNRRASRGKRPGGKGKTDYPGRGVPRRKTR